MRLVFAGVVGLLAGASLTAAMLAQTPGSVPADRPMPRGDANSRLAHEQLLEKRTTGRIDVYFAGDSITRRWGATDYPALLANWTRNFHGWNAANFGWGGDGTQHILWRIANGELDDVHPKVIVLLAGTNNLRPAPTPEAEAAMVADVVRGIRAILELMRVGAPGGTIVLMGLLPRSDAPALMPAINGINAALARLADGGRIRYLNINHRLVDETGRPHEGMLPDGLHPSVEAYQVWADALVPILTELIGPRAAHDEAPPPTGDPSAQRAPVAR